MMAVLVGLWAPDDDHDALDVGVAAFVILIGAILPLLWVAALRLVLASFNDLTLVSMTVPCQVIHWEAMVLTCLVHDLIEFCMASRLCLDLLPSCFSTLSMSLPLRL